MKQKMKNVREYNEGEPVEIDEEWTGANEGFRPIIVAVNEGGHNATKVDLIDLIAWVKENRPELLKEISKGF